MTGMGGLNPTPGALTVALVQQQVPSVAEPGDIERVADEVAEMLVALKTATPAIDLVVFPEYGLQGLRKSAWVRDDMMLTLNSAPLDTLRAACRRANVWGCFSLMEANPDGAPFNSGVIVDGTGDIALYQRKLHPWVPKEPWEPGDQGVQVCDGPAGSRLALIICHDGMFPEVAREASYLGANVLLRTAGYRLPFANAWRITNEANAFCNLAYTASVALAGHDGNHVASMGQAMICDHEGTILVRGDATADRVVIGEIEPARADNARRAWGPENNIYQLGHRGFTALADGRNDCPYTYVADLAAGRYRVPWEAEVVITDGTADGYGPPRRPGDPTDTARGAYPR
ncbi:formamidase [Gordonia sp. MP11Mi]|uniref:Formamidase n=1 Tax=Gordonia sp. MP11Mi TaxID=3022769 RepID=A0AA97CVR4_9ACTN